MGEEVEIACVSGHSLIGYQYLRCLPDQTWTQQHVECQRKKEKMNKMHSNKIEGEEKRTKKILIRVFKKRIPNISEKIAF